MGLQSSFVSVADASSNSEPYSSLFSYLFGRGGRDVSRRSDQSQSTLGSEFLGRKKRAYDDDGMDRLLTLPLDGQPCPACSIPRITTTWIENHLPTVRPEQSPRRA